MRLRFFAALLLAPISLHAQTPAPPPANVAPSVAPATQPIPNVAPQSPATAAATSARPLTLEAAIALALDKNFDLQIQRLATDSARDTLVIADAVYDPAFNASAARFQVQDTDGVTSQSGYDTRLGVSQNLLTGGSVSATGAIDRSRFRPPLTAGLNPVYNSDVTLSVRQPLLKNFGLAANRATIDRARLGVARADYDLQSAVLFTIRGVESAFYDLAFARAQLDVRRFSLEVAQKLLDENKARRDAGAAIELDVLQAEVGVANARRALLQAEQTARNTEDNLLALINPFAFAVAPGPLVLPALGAVKVSFDHSYKLARDHAPDLVSTQLAVEQLKLDALVARNNRRPDLEVGATLGYNAREDSYGRAASEVWGSDGYNWQLDATVTLPWGLRADRARHRQALSALNRQELVYRQVDQDLLVQVRASIRAVETNDESMRIAALATTLSAKQFELEKSRYDAGLSTFRRVQEAQEDLDNARINELLAQLTLRNALADLARLEASSLTHYRVSLAP
jgi:outer membrane protein TolC